MTGPENKPKRLPPARNPVARRFAMIILLISVLALGFSLPMTASGDLSGALRICLGAVAINVLVLLFGAWASAGSRRLAETEAEQDGREA